MAPPNSRIASFNVVGITRSEMETILEPLRMCVERMEGTLNELARETYHKPYHRFATPVVDKTSADQARLGNDAPPVSMPLPPIPDQRSTETVAQPVGTDMDPQSNQNTADDNGAPKLKNSKTSISQCDKDDGQLAGEHLYAQMQVKAELDKDAKKNVGVVAPLLFKLVGTWNRVKEPERHTLAFRITQAGWFEALCLFAIMFNSCLVAFTTDWTMKHIGEEEPAVLYYLEKACVIWFLFELSLRLVAHKQYFFFNNDMGWNILDLVLVCISMVDVLVSEIVKSQDGSNVAFMRVVRLLKLTRVMRTLRSFHFFQQLALLVESFQRSIISLFWGFVMLFFVLYIFALIFMQACFDYITLEDKPDPLLEKRILDRFGTFAQTLLTLYSAVTGGDDWLNVYQILEPIGSIYGTLMAFFTFFFLFCLFNILTGSLVEKAMASSKPDRTEEVLRKRHTLSEEKNKLMEICKSMDVDRNGVISFKEFQEWMANPVLMVYMGTLGIEIHDVRLFFQTVGARSGRGKLEEGQVTIEHFVEGCMHMKGTATAIDMQRQLFEMHAMHVDLQHIEKSMLDRLNRFDLTLNRYFVGLAQMLPAPPPQNWEMGPATDMAHQIYDV